MKSVQPTGRRGASCSPPEAEHEAARAEREAARAEHEELAELVQALRDTIDDLEDRLGGDGAAPAARRARSEP